MSLRCMTQWVKEKDGTFSGWYGAYDWCQCTTCDLKITK